MRPIEQARAILEARIPPAMRGDDWASRWNELEAMANAPASLQQIGLSGRPMVEELRQAFAEGHLTAAECSTLTGKAATTLESGWYGVIAQGGSWTPVTHCENRHSIAQWDAYDSGKATHVGYWTGSAWEDIEDVNALFS